MDERSPRLSEQEIVVLVDSDGGIARVSERAESVLTDEELLAIAAETRRVVNDVGITGTARWAVELGDLEIVRLTGEDGERYLVTVIEKVRDELRTLTPRQRQIALHASSGKTVSEIAWETDLSANTVKYHLKSIYKRLNVSSRFELAAALSPEPSDSEE